MSNGDTDTSKTKKTAAEKASIVGADLTKLGETIETLFGKPSASPTTPGHVSSGPPSITAPPTSAGARYDPRGAAGGSLPPAPSGVLNPQPQRPAIQSMGTEYATPQGMRGAVASSALSSVVGAISDIANKKKQEKIQHAEFLYNLVKSAYESGDTQTANIILQDDKNRQLIEKYLTGNLPRVPGQAMGETPAPLTKGGPATGSVPTTLPKGKVAGINEPGGIALPRPSQQSQMAAAVQNMIIEGLKNKDPRILDKVLGEGASLSEQDYTKATKAKFGIELSPAQIQVLDAKSQLALAETKADVLKYVIGQGAQTERAVAVAKIHAGAEVQTGLGHDKARLEVAKNYRDFLLKVKGTAPDKMEMVMYQGLSKLYTDMAKNSITQSVKLMKDSPEMAKQLETEAKDYVKKAEAMKSQYEAGKFLDDLLKGGVPEGEEEPEPEEEPNK